MFKSKELSHIALAIIVLIFVVNFHLLLTQKTIEQIFLVNSISITLVVIINIIAKKLTAYYFESEIEHSIWSGSRYGFRPHDYLKTKIPYGVVIPFLITIISYGYILWFALLEFEIKPLPQRSSKRHGIYRFSEVTDTTLGTIAASGLIVNLLFAIIGYILGFSEFAKFSIYYAFFSILPLGNLDGSKIFFGSTGGKKPILWIILLTICAIFMAFVFVI